MAEQAKPREQRLDGLFLETWRSKDLRAPVPFTMNFAVDVLRENLDTFDREDVHFLLCNPEIVTSSFFEIVDGTIGGESLINLRNAEMELRVEMVRVLVERLRELDAKEKDSDGEDVRAQMRRDIAAAGNRVVNDEFGAYAEVSVLDDRRGPLIVKP